MAGRKQRNTVDYFSHYVNSSGRTKRILRQRFGGDGVGGLVGAFGDTRQVRWSFL